MKARDKTVARRLAVEIAVFRAWCHLGKARGRPEHELAYSRFCIKLGLIEESDGTGPYINLKRLNQLPDREMRHATIAAARRALEKGKTD